MSGTAALIFNLLFKSILRIFIGLVILTIFIGTIYYLYAKSQKKPATYKIETPFVLGCVIDLQNCLNIPSTQGVIALRKGYDDYEKVTSFIEELRKLNVIS